MIAAVLIAATLIQGSPCKDALVAAHPGVAWSADSGLVADVTFDKKVERIYWGRADTMFVVGIIECDRERPAAAWKFELAPMECTSGGIEVTLEDRPSIPQAHYDEQCDGVDERADCIALKTLMDRLAAAVKSYPAGKAVRIGPRDCEAYHLFWDIEDRRFRAWRG